MSSWNVLAPAQNSRAVPSDAASLKLVAIDPDGMVQYSYLYVDRQTGLPIVLGTGRTAVVCLARTSQSADSPANEYRAIKFLKDDVDKEYAEETTRRFFDEAQKTRNFGRLHGSFVRYYSQGFIGTPREKWQIYYGANIDHLLNEDTPFAYIQQYFFLQGPFYVLELCQGTLHDLLDKSIAIERFNTYRHIEAFQAVLQHQAEEVAADIATLQASYMAPGRQVAGLSGYEILNAFRTTVQAQQVRNYAVLELFERIVWTVRQLHSHGLAHRDLKPGNVFLQHTADTEGFHQVFIKLSDLGYVANLSQIDSGEVTLRLNFRHPGARIPGSQFYRAPEQAELPIEVRIDVDPTTPNAVYIRSSKIVGIDHGDWLSIGDYFVEPDPGATSETRADSDDLRDPGMYQIIGVCIGDAMTPDQTGTPSFRLILDRDIRLHGSEDLQAHVIKSTGFYTDGHSLGAMLYDLASGGKNPELFYTYCLLSFTPRFTRMFGTDSYTADDVLDILAPSSTTTERWRSVLQLRPTMRWSILWHALRARSIDDLMARVIAQAQPIDETAPRAEELMRHHQFRAFHLVSDLLRDCRGMPIPRGILQIIVKCMLRDVPGAYYKTIQDTAERIAHNQRAAEQMHRDIRALLGQAHYQLPSVFPASLRANLLFKLRALATAVPEQPAPDTLINTNDEYTEVSGEHLEEE